MRVGVWGLAGGVAGSCGCLRLAASRVSWFCLWHRGFFCSVVRTVLKGRDAPTVLCTAIPSSRCWCPSCIWWTSRAPSASRKPSATLRCVAVAVDPGSAATQLLALARGPAARAGPWVGAGPARPSGSPRSCTPAYCPAAYARIRARRVRHRQNPHAAARDHVCRGRGGERRCTTMCGHMFVCCVLLPACCVACRRPRTTPFCGNPCTSTRA